MTTNTNPNLQVWLLTTLWMCNTLSGVSPCQLNIVPQCCVCVLLAGGYNSQQLLIAKLNKVAHYWLIGSHVEKQEKDWVNPVSICVEVIEKLWAYFFCLQWSCCFQHKHVSTTLQNDISQWAGMLVVHFAGIVGHALHLSCIFEP